MNDTETLKSLIAESIATGRVVQLESREYNTTEPLRISGTCRVSGNGAMVVAATPMRAVIEVVDGRLEADHLTIHGGLNAQHAMTLRASSRCRFTDCIFMKALLDGVLNEGETACCNFERCAFEHNGTEVTGTLSVPPGGGKRAEGDFGVVRPFDFVRVGAEMLQVASVHESGVTLSLHPPTAGHEVTAFTAGVGCGYREELSSDSNLNAFEDCLFRGNKGSGASFHGLYGPRVSRAQCDFNGGFGFAVGMAAGSNVIVSSFRDCYFEENAGTVFLGYATQVVLDSMQCASLPQISNPSFVSGVLRGAQGTHGGDIPLGDSPRSDLAAARLQTQGAAFTGNPPAIPNASPMGSIVFNYAPLPGQPVGWVKLGASPYSEWAPFGKVY